MVSIWFPLIYNAHHVSHLLSFHFTFLLPCRTQHSGGRSPWAVFRPRAISDHGCRRGGGSIDGYLQIDWYIWYMTYVYIYMHSIYCYMGVWELYRSQLHICREREKERVRTLLSAFAVCLHINMRYDGDMQCMFVLLCWNQCLLLSAASRHVRGSKGGRIGADRPKLRGMSLEWKWLSGSSWIWRFAYFFTKEFTSSYQIIWTAISYKL